MQKIISEIKHIKNKKNVSDIKRLIPGVILIVTTILANFLNFFFNAYLGRQLEFEELGLISLIGSLLYFSYIPQGALHAAINYKSAFLIGRLGEKSAIIFWKRIRLKVAVLGIIATVVWLAIVPFIASYFNSRDFLPFILFTPVIVFGLVSSVDKGFLNAKLAFLFISFVTILEPVIKLLVTALLLSFGLAKYAYISIPISVIFSFIAIWIYLFRSQKKTPVNTKKERFAYKFFFGSFVSGLATISFFSLDIVLAKHFLSEHEAGQYALLSLIGKMIFFLGGLSQQFLTPLAARFEGQNKDSKKVMYAVLASTIILTFSGFVALGLLGDYVVPILFGEKARSILPYLIPMSLATMLFTVSRTFVSFHLIKKSYTFPIIAFLLSGIQVVLIELKHANVNDIVNAMFVSGIVNLVLMIILHMCAKNISIFEKNIRGALLTVSKKNQNVQKVKQKIASLGLMSRKAIKGINIQKVSFVKSILSFFM